MTLTPHELVQIGAHHLFVDTLHSLKFGLNSVPIRLYVLSMDASCRIDKLNAVIHRLVLCHRGEMLNIIVCSPHVTPHNRSRANMLLDYGEESGSIPLGNYLHHTKCWTQARVHHTKHPTGRAWWTTSVVLH